MQLYSFDTGNTPGFIVGSGTGNNFTTPGQTFSFILPIQPDGSSIVVFNELGLGINLLFGNGAVGYVPYFDCRQFLLSGPMAQGSLQFKVDTTGVGIFSNSTIFYVEIYQPSEAFPEVYPISLVRTVIIQ